MFSTYQTILHIYNRKLDEKFHKKIYRVIDVYDLKIVAMRTLEEDFICGELVFYMTHSIHPKSIEYACAWYKSC